MWPAIAKSLHTPGLAVWCAGYKPYGQGYHRTTPKNKNAAVRLPKNQILFIVKPLKVGEDQKKRSSRPQSPVFSLKIGEKKVFTSAESYVSR